MKTTLLVLAAGMGSRYGGLKQMDAVGPSGETLLDYSVYDAADCGFERVVFVIRRDFEEEFRERVGHRYEDRLDVGYAFQQLNDLPTGFSVPDGRQKPWGTGHAVLSARDAVDTPFMAINADDFYGHGAFATVGRFLRTSGAGGPRFCMGGYRLDATLSEHGTVSRGVCQVDAEGFLKTVREHTKIERTPSGIMDLAENVAFTGAERVSMNCWGFNPDVFPLLEEGFQSFFEKRGQEEKSEFYIPLAVAEMISQGAATVQILPVESQWFGVTYQEDRPLVVAALAELTSSGDYPSPLA
ncbi:MAG: NTP transferase domain-containing protein [bacterium]